MLETKIKDACRKMSQDGWTIRPGIYYAADNSCCPLVALAMVEGTLHSEEELNRIWARPLGWALTLNERQVNEFVTGFDGDPPYWNGLDISTDEEFQLGRRLREWVDGGMR